MKKFLSVIMCILMLIPLCGMCIGVSAETVSVDTATLDSRFLDGQCPGELDYVYYEPESKENVKYPLMIWLHGAKSGDKPRAQLEWYRFSHWASPEYQARFENAGGAFLLAPRSSKDITNNWYESGCGSLKATIDYFISQHKDKIDTSRIYISGYSTGGSMVWHMVTKYPDFFAAAMPIASLYNPSTTEMNRLGNTSIWIFCCDKDFYTSAATEVAEENFKYLSSVTNRPEGVRITSFTEAIWPWGTKQNAHDKEHYIWGAVTNDMIMDSDEPYYYATTKDASGETITIEKGKGVISWLSAQTNESNEELKSLSLFEKLLAFFRDLFQKILGMFGI